MQLLLIFLVIFLGVAILLRVPVAFAIGIGGTAVFLLNDYSLNSLAQSAFYGIDNFSLLAIPFFLFAGAVMEYSGISDSIFNFINAFVGRVRASTGTVAVFACALFGALTGSTQATIASIGKIVFPQMDREGYEPAYQAALMASAGFLGVLIPPSMTGIIYAAASGLSIADAWMSTLLPGIGLAIMFSIINYMHRRKVETKSIESFSFPAYAKNIGINTKNALLALLMPVIIFGGIYGGVFTATEAGAVSAVYGLIYYIVKKVIKPEKVTGSIKQMLLFAISLSGVILLIMSLASIACKAIAFGGVSQMIVEWMTANIHSPVVFLIIVNVLFIICGMFIDSNAAILLFVPLLTPVATAFDISQIQLAGIILVNLCAGAISPPFCVNVFVTSKLKDAAYVDVVHYIWPFLGACIIMLILMCFIPGLTVFMPSLLA